MKASCPRDGHGKFLADGARLDCPDKSCRCAECHRTLSEQERKDWAPK